MYIDVACVSCFVSQAEAILKKFVGSREERLKIINDVVLSLSKNISVNLKPIQLYPYCYNVLYDRLGIDNFYKKEKSYTNNVMRDILDGIIDDIMSYNPIKNSMKLSIIGNLIDYGIKENRDIATNDPINILKSYMMKDFVIDDFEKFLTLLPKAKNMVFLTDNSGEIIFDKVFIQIIKKKYPDINIYIAGRDTNVLNDITYDDLIDLGFDKIATVVKNGIRLPGAIESLFNPEFIDLWENADIVIAKGQGNFEGLNDSKKPNVFFALVAKCKLIADTLGVEKGSMIFKMGSN